MAASNLFAWLLLAMVAGAGTASAQAPGQLTLATYIPTFSPAGAHMVNTEQPGADKLQLASGLPFDVTVMMTGFRVSATARATGPQDPLHQGQMICSYYDNANNYYFAIQSVDTAFGSTEWTSSPTGWNIVGASPLGGNCPSLQLSDPACVPCPTNSTQSTAGCMPRPGGILFASPSSFPLGAQVGVGCQFQAAPNMFYSGQFNQLTWEATVINPPLTPDIANAVNPVQANPSPTPASVVPRLPLAPQMAISAPVPAPAKATTLAPPPTKANTTAPAPAPAFRVTQGLSFTG